MKRDKTKTTTKGKNYYQPVLIAVLLSVLVLVTYRNAYDNEFVDWDDYTYVVDNKLVRNPEQTTLKDVFSTPVSLNYHPLTILSLRMNNNQCKTCTEGISAAPFIKWNVFIHLMNTLLVFWLIFMLTKKNVLAAFIVAAIFGVHPMHVESVAWVSERKDVLYSFFFLSGLITFIKYLKQESGWRQKYLWLGATFLIFILSCLSKAMAVVFPLVLLLIKFWMHQPKGDSPIKESIKETLSLKSLLPLFPFFAVSLFFGILAISINNQNAFNLWHRIQYASYGFIMYIVKFFVPVNQAAIYPYPSEAEYLTGTFGTLLKITPFAMIAVLGLVIFSMKKTKLYVFGLGFFLITIMMVLQFISIGFSIMSDRYTYLPYIGLAFVPAMLIGEMADTKRIASFVLAGCFIIVMMFASHKQIKVWRNSETLWTKAIDRYPSMETARSIRGIYYSKKADRAQDAREKTMYEEKAFNDFRVAIKENTARADVYEGAGNIYGRSGDYANALVCLNKSIELKPRKGSAYFNRALTLSLLNRKEEAIKDYTIALVYAPQMAVAIITNRSNLYLETGKFKEAITDFDFLVSIDSKNFIFYYNRAISRLAINDKTGASSDFQKALLLQPEDTLTKDALKKLNGR